LSNESAADNVGDDVRIGSIQNGCDVRYCQPKRAGAVVERKLAAEIVAVAVGWRK